MRALLWTLPGLLLFSAVAAAQQASPAAQPAPPAATAAKLDEVLGGWERAMTGLTSFVATTKRTSLDKSLNSVEVLEGKAEYLKGQGANQPSRASLELFNRKRPQVFEKYVCTGDHLYEWSPSKQVIRVHKLPPAKPGQVGDDNFLQFLFGMKSVEAKNRYDMTYVPDAKTNQWYVYLLIRPKLAQDKGDFSQARLILMADTFLPRQLWYLQPNGNEITWDFEKVERNVHIPVANFDAPRQLPAGWRMEVSQQPRPAAQLQPVIRPQDR